MSEDGFIKFEITEDDIESEFNPFRAKRLTKNQQIYGSILGFFFSILQLLSY